MKEPFLKRMARDLLTLEINTIIKEEMLAVKMPGARQALYELSGLYHKKLQELSIREPIYWQYAGMRSFGELRDRAKKAIEKFEKDLKTASKDEEEDIRENIKILERIQEQSSEIVGIFYQLKESVKDKIGKIGGYSDVPEHVKREILEDMKNKGELKPVDPHRESEMWNNDIDRQRMNEIEDLSLTTEQITLIRKAWEIGTERIVLQTVIQIDGDVTTRISKHFSKNPDDAVLHIHNDSISTSTEFWSTLVKTLTEIAGKAFKAILGK